ncbi:c-type cytochrome [Pseudomonas sp. PDM31]|uniref:c-type cytochrome n=1 Tax=Pseudomonas sp. PDM31 TaxID=2854778 RepID=UPI001C452B31|nr:cytochrome c family protein [Pseudomonas sp. PDM31]MBV7479262.1 cytochrome c family protein [Pseudomonas sp. PDM31]
MKKIAALTFAAAILLSTPASAAGDAQAGQKVYKRMCSGCHQIGESARAFFGPQLNGVIGRPSAVTTDYVYSDAMKSANLVWDRDTLIAYIEAPKKVVPGTRMIFWGLSDPEKIDDLLAYLETFKTQ